MVLLAVYGTLKQGHHNHNIHLNKKPVFAEFVDMRAEMYTNGRYPMLVKSENKGRIYIEIYEITEKTLEEIDKLEEPFGYHRESKTISGYNNVWVYYYSDGIPPENFVKVDTGNFVKERDW